MKTSASRTYLSTGLISQTLAKLDSLYRLDISAVRAGEIRTQSFSNVMGCLQVLTVIHIDRDGDTRVISYRRARTEEREAYWEWISDKCHDAGTGQSRRA